MWKTRRPCRPRLGVQRINAAFGSEYRQRDLIVPFRTAAEIEFIGAIEETMRLLAASAYEQAQQLVMTKLSAVSKPMFEQGERLRSMLETGSQVLKSRQPIVA